jgi:hypothetical protein
MKGGPERKKRKDMVSVDGPWLPMPIEFLRSRACATLSPHAIKLLMDMCSMLGANAYANGDLAVYAENMAVRGWTSSATLRAALQELLRAELIVITRQGGKNLCSLYAITLWPLHCNQEKLDVGPGAYTTSDWQHAGGCEHHKPPLDAAPATWNRVRKNTIAAPVAGLTGAAMSPQREHESVMPSPIVPAAGAVDGLIRRNAIPPRDSFLDNHLGEPSDGGVGSAPAPFVDSPLTAPLINNATAALEPATPAKAISPLPTAAESASGLSEANGEPSMPPDGWTTPASWRPATAPPSRFLQSQASLAVHGLLAERAHAQPLAALQ